MTILKIISVIIQWSRDWLPIYIASIVNFSTWEPSTLYAQVNFLKPLYIS